MKRSFVRLVVASVLGCWAVALCVVVAYSMSRSWIDSRSQGDGVFLFGELLDQTATAERPQRLKELQQHSSLPLGLISRQEVERRVGHSVGPSDAVPLRAGSKEEWYFITFTDGEGALAIGPVDPTDAEGMVPIGLLVAFIGLPAIAGLIALRVERELAKVERASQAIAVGELSVRVDNPRGPSNELAASFNAMAERIEHLIRSRDELVQAVSHEFGSPLSRLRFHMELLATESEAQREQRLDAMARDLDSLDDLVAELLSYVQSDELKLEPRTFDPSQGLADLAELAGLELADERAVDVRLNLQRDVSVHADQRHFQRAVENILRNAMLHTKTAVEVELLTTDRDVRVIVHDDGPGIPEELRDKVMAPFFRLDADRSRKTGGVGLGLAIVSRIMLKHGGRVEIGTSRLGGAKVATVWPRRSPPSS